MQTSQTDTINGVKREEIDFEIAESKERLYEFRHKHWWFTYILRGTFLGVTVAVIAYTLLPFTPPVVQSVLENLGGIAVFVSIVGVLASIVLYGGFEDLREKYESIRTEKRELAKLYRALALYDELSLKHLTAERYMHQLPNLIASYRKRADRYRNWFVTTQLITIFLSAAITSLSGGWLDRYFQIPWIIPVIGALISILTSLTLFFKFREKGTNLQQTADAMDWEHMACTLGIGHYKGMTKEVAQVELAEKAEALRQEQQKKQLQLEQSSHSEQKALQSTP